MPSSVISKSDVIFHFDLKRFRTGHAFPRIEMERGSKPLSFLKIARHAMQMMSQN